MALGVDEELKKNALVCFILAMLTALLHIFFFFLNTWKTFLNNPKVIEMLEVQHKEWFLEASSYELLT